jgi:hypothetical protein
MRSVRLPVAGLLIAIIVTLGFFLLFFNRFAGMRSGLGGFGGGDGFVHGALPYRDYFLASSPLNILTSGAVLSIFGDKIIVTRAFGVFERLVIAALLYAWLRRLFSVRDAMIATIVTVVASAGDFTDAISSYNHETLMWAIGSGFAASFALDDKATYRRLLVAAILSGFLAGLAFATKQTMGLGATVFIPIAVALCLLRLAGIRKAAAFVLFFAMGWAVSAGVLVLWLAELGVVHEFLKDTFVKGPAAKGGSPNDFLGREVLVARGLWYDVALGLIGVLLFWNAWRRSGVSANSERPDSFRRVLVPGLLCALAIALGAAVSYAGMPPAKSMAKAVIYLDLFGSLALIFRYFWLWLRGTLSAREAQFALLATVSFVMAFMVSLSYPVFEAMLLPGLAFLLAAALDGLSVRWATLTFVGCGVLLLTQTTLKLDRPFGFEDWNEPPVRTAIDKSTIPELQGLRLPPDMVQFIEGTAAIVKDHAGPKDTIFTYPEMGIFYVVTRHGTPTLSGSHNTDVVSDAFASEEAKRLLAGRPAVLIYGREDEGSLRAKELMWRKGHRAGQRDIIDAMEKLASEYELVRTFNFADSGRLVRVYVRR